VTDRAAPNSSIRSRRVQYETPGLEIFDLAGDPMAQWHAWHDEALTSGVAEPNAMVLSTVDLQGEPDSRIVLVRGADEYGFTFFTNYESAKSHQLSARPIGAATFSWLDLHRQVRVRGSVERVSDSENDEYFASRPRESQIGAWASPQSEVLRDRDELDEMFVAAAQRFDDGPVPRPSHWGGWRLVPDEWEFWQGRPNRLHDRLRYRLVDEHWQLQRLAP